MTTVALDSSVLGHILFIDAPPSGQEDERAEASGLLDSAHKLKLVVPALALAEVLAINPKRVDLVLSRVMDMSLEVQDFDATCSALAAKWMRRALKTRGKAQRNCTKTDVFIMATAVRWGADALCAFDGDFAAIRRNEGLSIDVGAPRAFTGGQLVMEHRPAPAPQPRART